ncbi:MAG: phosphotransferase [Planctomycetota bacterium]
MSSHPRPATTTDPDAADAGSPGSGGSRAGQSFPGAGADLSAVPSLGSGHAGRQTFAPEELAVVLSHYDLGVLEEVREYPRGSRKAPKLIVRTADRAYLLKRRARGRDDPHKVAFCHGVQRHLADRQFPLPHLIGTRHNRNSMLTWNNATYELFEFIQGSGYDQSLEATAEAGRTLALFHKLLADHRPKFQPSRGSYHAARSVPPSCNAIPTTLMQTEPDLDRQEVGRLTQFLHESYQEAARRTKAAGLEDWPLGIAHADWHPGNMLFRGPRVVAVIDYDAARMQQRILDASNGALQFSMIGKGDDPEEWPDYPDESRLKRFVRGYDSVPDAVLSRAELRVLPHLMIEALVAESVIPIGATGMFGRMPGGRFLPMVERKVRWFQKNADKLVAALED